MEVEFVYYLRAELFNILSHGQLWLLQNRPIGFIRVHVSLNIVCIGLRLKGSKPIALVVGVTEENFYNFNVGYNQERLDPVGWKLDERKLGTALS